MAMSSARRRRVESGDVSEPRQGYFTITILCIEVECYIVNWKQIKIVIIFSTWNQCIQEMKQDNTKKIGPRQDQERYIDIYPHGLLDLNAYKMSINSE